MTHKTANIKKLTYKAKEQITILEWEDCTRYTDNLQEHFRKDLSEDIIWEPMIINTQEPFSVSSSHDYSLD